MKKFIWIFLIISCNSNNKEAIESQISETNPEAQLPHIDVKKYKPLPKGFILTKNDLTDMVTRKEPKNASGTLNGYEYNGVFYPLSIGGKEVLLIVLDDMVGLNYGVLGCADAKNSAVYLNRPKIKKAYDETKFFLEGSHFGKQIIPIEYFFEAVLRQEIWHVLNPCIENSIENLENEYFSEFPSLDCKGGDFYLAFRYLKVLSYNDMSDRTHKLVINQYIKAFRFQKGSLNVYNDSLYSLYKEYGFEGIKNRYKGIK